MIKKKKKNNPIISIVRWFKPFAGCRLDIYKHYTSTHIYLYTEIPLYIRNA